MIDTKQPEALITTHGQVPAIQRYKIGYNSDEWGVRSSTPSGIQDASGSWVRYADHVTALKAAQPVVTPQPGAAHAAPQFPSHPEPMVMDWSALEISVIAQYGRDMYEAGKRQSHGQAPASKIEGLTAAQESLGVEFEKVLHDNLFDLYEESAPHGQAPAQAAPAAVAGPSEAVAYLDIGAGGYLDLGTDLTDEALSRLPKGRHALVIAGTYGIDGYIAAPTTQAAQGIKS